MVEPLQPRMRSEPARSEPARSESASWAVAAHLESLGHSAPPLADLFGFGSPTWLHLDAGDGRGGAEEATAVLRGVHPDRLHRTFWAVGVWAHRYRYLSTDAFRSLVERHANGLTTFVELDARVLAGHAPRPRSRWSSVAIVQAVDGAIDEESVHVLSVHHPDGVTVSRERFLEAWGRPLDGRSLSDPSQGDPSSDDPSSDDPSSDDPSSDDRRLAVWYMNPTSRVTHRPINASVRAILRIVQQMAASVPSLGVTGVDALARFAERVAAGDLASLHATADLALDDGAEAFHRDHTAAFFHGAAERLASDDLARAADRFDEAAAGWRSLFRDRARGASPDDAARALRRLHRLESDAVEAASAALDGLAREVAA